MGREDIRVDAMGRGLYLIGDENGDVIMQGTKAYLLAIIDQIDPLISSGGGDTPRFTPPDNQDGEHQFNVGLIDDFLAIDGRRYGHNAKHGDYNHDFEVQMPIEDWPLIREIVEGLS